MEGLPPEIQEMLRSVMQQYEDNITELQQENRNLADKLSIYERGNQYNQQDYETLQSKFRAEQDDKHKLDIRCRDLEMRLQELTRRNQEYEARFHRTEEEMKSYTQSERRYKEQIDDLKAKLLQKDQSAQHEREKSFSFIEEREQMRAGNKALVKQNDEMAQIIEVQMEREKELSRVMAEKEQYIAEIEGTIDVLQQKLLRYQNEIIKLRKGGAVTSGEDVLAETVAPSPRSPRDPSFDPALELQRLREENLDLKQRVLTLEEEEHRAARLQKTLEKRNVVIEGLRKEIEERDEQIMQYNVAKGDMIQQIDTYRQRVEEKSRENMDELAEAKQTAEDLEGRYKVAKKRLHDLEEMFNKNKTELEEMRHQIEGYRNGTYGLPEAMNEMRELRAMVEVRDNHIADLVSQLNTMDKIMMGLTRKLDPNFNLEEFLKKLTEIDMDEERIRTEKAARDLEAKIQLMKERGPAGQIKIVVGNDSRPVKTYVVENEQQPEVFTSHAARAFRSRHRPSEAEAPDAVVIPPDQAHIRGKKKFQVDKGEKSIDMEKKRRKSSASQTNAEASENSSEDKEKKPESPRKASPPALPMAPMSENERDEWVIELREHYITAKRERDELQKQLDELRAEYDRLLKDMKGSRGVMADDRNADTVIGLRKPLDAIPTHASYATMPRDTSTLTVRSTQTKPQASLDVVPYSVSFEKMKAPPLEMCRINSETVILPSPEQRAVFEARQNALRTELDRVLKELSEKEIVIGDFTRKLEQREQMLDKLKDTIAGLEKQLIEQRELYQERLATLRKESYEYADKKVKEAMDVRYVDSKLSGVGATPQVDLAEVSSRISQLNRDKERLEEMIREEKASAALAQRQAAQLRQRLREVEMEKEDLKSQMEKSGAQYQMQEYSAEVHLRLKNLERRCAQLKRENAELKHSRPGRNDPLAESDRRGQHAIDQNDEEEVRDNRRLKSAEAKLMTLKTQNEEMQLRLGKANGTIERLNQLLQRKEAQLAKLKDQASQFKQQVISKQKEVNTLRMRGQRPS